ncbi:hypothetical protein PR048_031269 [Dryococelus australis]|uniref:Uncharacterized protein n=1 Tax=Dryococelus australis TaxID=614101 RepID=A0ABQ9G5X5_9NEOP|nr:hypothetical protein PR048_031269 [Dryococelus australis]
MTLLCLLLGRILLFCRPEFLVDSARFLVTMMIYLTIIRPYPDKTSCVFYTNEHRHPPPPPTLQAAVLSWSPVAKYLVMHLDTILTWHHHIALALCHKMTMCACSPGPDIHRSGLGLCSFMLLASSMSIQLCFLGRLGRPHRTAVVTLYKLAGVESLAALICQVTSRFYHRAAAHLNPLITEIGDYDVVSPGSHRQIRPNVGAFIQRTSGCTP